MMEILFNDPQKCINGMIHVGALPGTPKYSAPLEQLISKAVSEARFYEECGLDAVMIENMHDVPYLLKDVGPEITASMTAIASEVKRNIELPIGIQILAGANKQALAAAKAAGLDFIRAEGFLFSHIADEGLMNADAGELCRYRKQIDAENISILTDIKKKHSSHSITSDISITEFAGAAEFFLSDGLIITGSSTGSPADIREIEAVRKVAQLPLLIGSGITDRNIADYWNYADGFIIGSYFKENGYWENALSRERIDRLMNKVQMLRNKSQ